MEGSLSAPVTCPPAVSVWAHSGSFRSVNAGPWLSFGTVSVGFGTLQTPHSALVGPKGPKRRASAEAHIATAISVPPTTAGAKLGQLRGDQWLKLSMRIMPSCTQTYKGTSAGCTQPYTAVRGSLGSLTCRNSQQFYVTHTQTGVCGESCMSALRRMPGSRRHWNLSNLTPKRLPFF